MKLRGIAIGLVLLFLTGCTSLLEREYSVIEPHSSKFWESEAAGTLRAENAQDIVNDLLLLIGQHTETATIRLYNVVDGMRVADMLAHATIEIQQETPMGAYAVEFITTTTQEQRGYYEISVQIGYRRSVEQMQAVVNATSPEAIYSLLESALDEGKTELAVRIGYWGADGQEKVETAMAQLREDRGLTEGKPWLANYYPEGAPTGLVEILLDPPEELIAERLPLPEVQLAEGDNAEELVEGESTEEAGGEVETSEETAEPKQQS